MWKHAPMAQELPRQTATFLIDGFSEGFLLPKFKGRGCVPVENLPSVINLSLIVEEKLQKRDFFRIAGPFPSPPFDNLSISPIGMRA